MYLGALGLSSGMRRKSLEGSRMLLRTFPGFSGSGPGNKRGSFFPGCDAADQTASSDALTLRSRAPGRPGQRTSLRSRSRGS